MIKLFLNTVFDWGKAKTVFVNEFFKFVFIAVFFFLVIDFIIYAYLLLMLMTWI